MVTMEKKADIILEKARGNVRDRLAHVDSEIEQFLLEAEERGKKRGTDEERELSRRLQLMRSNMIQELRVEIVRSAVEVAREVLREETEVNPEVVVQTALRAFASIPDAKSVLLRVSHEDVEHLKKNKDRLLEGLERAKEVDVRADRTVVRGGLIIQTESGIIDAQISTQLEEIAAGLGV